MNNFTNNKLTKKFIIILVMLILFNFCYPKPIHALIGFDDLEALPLSIFYMLFKGVYGLLNDIFTEDDYHTKVVRMSKKYYADALGIVFTPENIIKGKFVLFNADIFTDLSGETDQHKYYDDGISGIITGRTELRNVIAGWYYALRNFAIIALLSVLVYVGIRMVISTIAQDKAKYKVMFKDWLVALCLVVLAHYIMIGTLKLTTIITEAIGSEGNGTDMIQVYTERISGMLSETYDENWTANDSYKYPKDGKIYTLSDGYGYIIVLYGVFIFSLIFAIKYLKREFTIIFLILLAPVSCITYPIDKISDGKAQAFNKWFTEFLYQVIIQPFHLLIYIVLVGTASALADVNILYTLVSFAVMIPAEKFVKEMFGFKDKLGSQLGGFAAGALASKAISSLTSGGKKGGVEKGKGDDNNSAQNKLPPKTVEDKGDLVDGKTESGNSVGQGKEVEHDNPALEAGEDAEVESDYNTIADTGENIADAATDIATVEAIDQIVDDQDGTLAADERMNEADGQKETMRQISDMVDQNNENSEQEKESQPGESVNLDENKKQGTWSKIMATHNKRVSEKYGTTSRGRRWVKRAGRGTRALATAALKTAKDGAVATIGAAAATGALLTGNGKEAMAIAAGVGGYFGKEAVNGAKKAIKGATGAVKSGYNDYIRTDKSKEKKAFNKFDADPKQQEKARLSYMENHDGKEPGYKELRQEMKDRFELSRYGLSDDEIDRALPIYQEKRDELLASGKSKEEAEKIAGSQAKQTAKFSKYWKESDYFNEATMSKAQDRIAEQLKSTAKCSDEVAQEYAQKYIKNAARMKGISPSAVALPGTKQTIDVQAPQRVQNVSASLGVADSDMTTQEVQRMNEITVRYHSAGFSSREVEQIASTCTGGSTTEILDKYEARVEYLNDGNAQEEAKMSIEARNNGRNATEKQVQAEMKERLILKSTFDVKDERELSSMRKLETQELKSKTQIQAAREFAVQNKGKLKNEAYITKAKKDLVEKLRVGGSSGEKAKKDAENIVLYAQNINGEI